MDQEGESQPMDWDEYEQTAVEEYDRAATSDELAEVHVRYLGRRSPLPQALRGVRDPETGQRLNSLRTRLEEKHRTTERRLARAELDRSLGDETFDPTLPGEAPPVGTLHPITQVRQPAPPQIPHETSGSIDGSVNGKKCVRKRTRRSSP